MRTHMRLLVVGVWLLAATASLVALSGCVSALATAMYVIRGNNVPAEFEGLKDRKVAVVCRPLVELDFAASGVNAEIARQVGLLLTTNVKKVKIVDPAKVAEWTDENSWDEYTEIGRALDAELVIGIDLENFRLYQSQTLFQGRANLALRVFDMKKDGEMVYQKVLPEVVFPPNRCIDTGSMPEDQFRRLFVADVAEQIGRSFYPHDAHADLAKDSAQLD